MSLVFFPVSSWSVPVSWENEDDPRNQTNQTLELDLTFEANLSCILPPYVPDGARRKR